jgi:hypothetical protein
LTDDTRGCRYCLWMFWSVVTSFCKFNIDVPQSRSFAFSYFSYRLMFMKMFQLGPSSETNTAIKHLANQRTSQWNFSPMRWIVVTV